MQIDSETYFDFNWNVFTKKLYLARHECKLIQQHIEMF